MSFEWISNETKPVYISVDKQYRLYLSQGTRQLLGLQPEEHIRLYCGYDLVNHRIVVAKPGVVNVPNVKPFRFDKRSYSKAKNYVENTGLKDANLPIRFDYVGEDFGEVPSGSYVFERADVEAPDDRGSKGAVSGADPNEPLGGQ